MKNLIPILLTLTSLACITQGGRIGLHGMVIYRQQGSYLLDHIPMEHAPHDLQVLSEIKLETQAGQILAPDLSNETYTLKPSSEFSLNDLAEGKLKTFIGDLFQGGFEHRSC